MDPELTAAQLAQARKEVKAARAKGFSDDDIGAYLKEEYGVGLDALQPKTRDFVRAGAQGATFGFLDRLLGLGAAQGGDQFAPTFDPKVYGQTRDAVRRNLEGARAIAPKRMLAAEVGGGVLPAIATMGASAGVQGGGALAKALASAKTGAGLGAVSGVGHTDDLTDIPQLLTNVGASATVGGAAGGLLSLGGSAINALRPTAKVLGEVEPLLPGDVAQRLARQNELAPRTAVLADQSQEMQAFVKRIGHSKGAAKRAVEGADERIRMLDKARSEVSKRYDPFQGTKLPVTDDLRALVGSKLKLGDEVDFKVIQDFRTEVGSELGKAIKASQRGDRLAGKEAHELGKLKEGLDGWLHPRVEGLAQIDADYGGILGLLKNARGTRKIARESQKNYGTSRAYGETAASPTASLTRPQSITDIYMGFLKPNPARRARIVERMLMRPENANSTLRSLLGEPSLVQRSLLFGGAELSPYLVPGEGEQ